MPTVPETDVKRRKLLGLGIHSEVGVVEDCVRRLEKIALGSGGSEWSIWSPKSPNRLAYLSHHSVKKIKTAWLAGNLGFLDEIGLDLAAASEADRQEDTLGQEWIDQSKDPNHPMFKLFEKRRQGAGINTAGISPEARYADFQKAKALAPEQMWTYEHMTSIGMNRDDALELLLEYDSIYYESSLAYVPRSLHKQDGTVIVTPRLLNFRGFSKFLTMHYSMHYRSQYITSPNKIIEPLPYIIRVASELRTRGVLESDEHLEIAGDGIMRYAVWEHPKNLEAFYQSLRNIKRRKSAHQRFVSYLGKELGLL
jgi:hypothetical protein